MILIDFNRKIEFTAFGACVLKHTKLVMVIDPSPRMVKST